MTRKTRIIMLVTYRASSHYATRSNSEFARSHRDASGKAGEDRKTLLLLTWSLRGDAGVLERRLEWQVLRGRARRRLWIVPRRDDPEADQSPGRPDQRLAGSDFVFPQVASHDAERRLERAGEQDRILGIASGSAVDG